MNLCSNNHEEICYETNPCPVCVLMEEVSELETQLDKLEEENDELKNQEK